MLDARIEAHPGDPDPLVARAGVFLDEGASARALVDLRRAQALEPGRKDLRRLIGLALLAAGRAAPAEEALASYLRRRPDHAGAHHARGRALVLLGRPAAAAAAFGDAIDASRPPRPEFYFARANALRAAHAPDVRPALRCLDEARASLGILVALEGYGVELAAEASLFDEALARLDRVSTQGERTEHWQVRRGEILAAAGRVEGARATLGSALRALDGAGAQARRSTPAQVSLRERAQRALASLGLEAPP